MNNFFMSALVYSVVSTIAATSSWAQSNFGYYSPQLQSDWYGNGTHQYFEGRFADAIISFSTAISVNPNDPRPYFYRGLARLSCGRGNGAEDDFQQGAFRETYKSGRASSAVNRALERIQGACRLEIERYRRDARLAYQMRRMMPSANSPPVIFGDMVDVDSIVPIIQHLVPSQNSLAPESAIESPKVPPSEDVGMPAPGELQSKPAEVVPQTTEPNGLPSNRSDPPPPDNQADDPFGG